MSKDSPQALTQDTSPLHHLIRSTDTSWAYGTLYENACSRCGICFAPRETPLLLANGQGRYWCYHLRCVGLPDPPAMDDEEDV